MNTFSVIFLVALFCVLQIVLLKKASKNWLKYLPTVIGGVGVGMVICYFVIDCKVSDITAAEKVTE